MDLAVMEFRLPTV